MITNPRIVTNQNGTLIDDGSKLILVEISEQGPKGAPGTKGDKGDPGATGPQGPMGQSILFQIDDLRSQISTGNFSFTTTLEYIPGTVVLNMNGTPCTNGQGIVELPPNTIELEPNAFGQAVIPKPGYSLSVQYFYRA